MTPPLINAAQNSIKPQIVTANQNSKEPQLTNEAQKSVKPQVITETKNQDIIFFAIFQLGCQFCFACHCLSQ